jgi:integral membrane protein
MGRLRLIGFLEGVSFIFLLGLAVPAKHLMGFPLLVRVSGPIHGLLFILFVVGVFLMAFERNWDRRITLKLMAASLIPFGNFYVDRTILKKMDS